MTLHNLSFAGAFVVDSAQVEHPVDNHTEKLGDKIAFHRFGIALYGVDGYKHVAADSTPVGVIDGDDVSVVIVRKKLAVDIEYLLVVTEDVSEGQIV